MRTNLTPLKIAAVVVTAGIGCISNASAQVGIGTITPFSTLEVSGNSSTTVGPTFGTFNFYTGIFSRPTRLNASASEISYGVLSHTNANGTGTYNAVAGRVLRTGNNLAANLTGAIAHVNQSGTNNFQTALLGTTNSRLDENNDAQVFSALRLTSDIDTNTLSLAQRANTFAIYSRSNSQSAILGRLGLGTITAPTHQLHIGAASDPLRLEGLQAGDNTDGLLSVNADGVVRRVPIGVDSSTASNGLTKTGNDIRLGGTLDMPTSIATSTGNTLTITGTGNASQSAALHVDVAPANLAPGTDIFGSRSTITATDGAATASSSPSTVRAQYSWGIATGNNVRAQGALNEASSTGQGLGQFNQPQATGATGLADYNGTGNAAVDDYLVGLRGATFTSGPTTNALNVVGQTFDGSFNRSVGGYFLPMNGTTNLGVVSQVGGTANQGWKDGDMAGRNIAVAALSYATQHNARAIYAEHMPVSIPDDSASFVTESVMNYAGTETGLIGGGQAVGGVRALTKSSDHTFQTQGGNFEARATGGGSGDFHAVGAIAVGLHSSTGNTGAGSAVVGLQGGAGHTVPFTQHSWDAIGVDGFTNHNATTTTGRTVGGHFDGAGGATQIGVIGTVDQFKYSTFDDASLDNMRIGVVAANTIGNAAGVDFALYGIGPVRLTAGDVVVGDVSATTPGLDDVTSAALQVNSTTQGFLPPRMSSQQAATLAATVPAEGLMIYVNQINGGSITTKGWYGWNGTGWEKLNP